MPQSNFPGGFAQGVSIRGVPLTVTNPGQTFWVHSGTGSNGNDGTQNRPFASIDYAVGRCTADRGDVIFVKPGHTETVTAAGGLDLDVAGVAVIGLGTGSLRPTINLTTATTADIDVDAANVTLYNVLITGGIDALVAVLDVNAADFRMIDCEYRDVTGECAKFLQADANASRMLIDGFVYDGANGAGTTAAINLVGGDRITLKNFWASGNFSTSFLDVATTATTKLTVSDGYVRTFNAADLCFKDTVTGSTGTFERLFLSLQDNAANITEAITGATFRVSDNVWVVNLDNEKAMLINWTASTDA